MLAMLVLATLAGRWEGAVQIPQFEVPLVLDLAVDAGGKWTGSATMPGVGLKGVPLADIVVHDNSATFVIKGALGDPKCGVSWELGGTLRGFFTQGGNSARMALSLVGPPQVDYPRQSSVVAKELEGNWTGEFQLNDRTVRADLALSGATAKFKLIGRRENDIPIDFVGDEAGFLSVKSSQTQIVLELRYLASKQELRGLFRQGPVDIPLTLHKK